MKELKRHSNIMRGDKGSDTEYVLFNMLGKFV